MIKSAAIIVSAGVLLMGISAPITRETARISAKVKAAESVKTAVRVTAAAAISEERVRATEVHYEFDKLKSDDYIENPFYYSGSYELSAEERDLVERTVMHEAGWCPDYRLLILTAQCIRNYCEMNGVRPAQTYSRCGYASMSYANPRSRKAVRDVFDRGIKCVDEDIFCYYNRNLVSSPLHEAQRLAIDIDGNRFFY